jgi:6-phosphogluconolactonase
VFDLLLLGMGDDGHVASLFPGAAALSVTDRWTTSSPPGVLPPPVDRVTLTFPALNAARQVMFLVSGANKAEALFDVLVGKTAATVRPAAGVSPANGRLVWLLDQAAAKLL